MRSNLKVVPHGGHLMPHCITVRNDNLVEVCCEGGPVTMNAGPSSERRPMVEMSPKEARLIAEYLLAAARYSNE